MSLKEKIAYLKGLAEGLGLDKDTKEGKLISLIIDTLSDMAEEIFDLGENALDIGEELDAISDDLSEIEEFLFDDDYGFDDDDDYDFDDFDDDDDDDDDECDCPFCNGEDFSYEIECPGCGINIELDESDLLSGSMVCAACGEQLDLDFDDDDDEDDEEDDD